MILSIGFQAKVFLTSVLIGALLGFIYDIIRIFRRVFIHNNFFVQIEDIIYWIFMSVIVFFCSLYQNNGEIRVFFIFGIFLGMILYFFSISILFIKFSTIILKFIKKVVLFIISCILMPFRIIYKIIYRVFRNPFIYIYNTLKNFIKILKNILQKSRIYVNMYNKVTMLKNKLKIKNDNQNK